MIVQTFSEIEKIKGIRYDKAESERSSLSAWYESIREKHFSEFSIGDWCRCVRQELCLEYVIPYALAELKNDPLAGDMYDGELANAFTLVRDRFWKHHREEREEVSAVFRSAYDRYPENVQLSIDEALQRWKKERGSNQPRP